MSISYSIVIRTLGYGGEKYSQLLKSIDAQTIRPEHVFVIIAEGYELPKERLGYEEFITTRKGMLHQRVYGLEYASRHCSSDYILCLDDDIAFSPEYAQSALKIIAAKHCEILFPSILDIGVKKSKKDQKLRRKIISFLTCSATESSSSKYRVAISRNGNFIVNRSLEGESSTQSGHGTGFWIINHLIDKLDMESEYWVEQCRYALPEDQVFAYKAFLNGVSMLHTTNLTHTHLDAGSSNTGPERLYHVYFAQGRNYQIFWHRYIYSLEKNNIGKIMDFLAISHRTIAMIIFSVFHSLRNKSFVPLEGYVKGLKDAKSYIRSRDYKKLSPVIVKE